jgi:epsilon-lactone hydrolase
VRRRGNSNIVLLKVASMAIAFAIVCAAVLPAAGNAAEASRVEKDGTIHVPAFDLPESSFLRPETRAALKQIREDDAFQAAFNACPSTEGAARADMSAIRQCQADAFYKTAFYRSVRDRYAVIVTPQMIGGVYTEVFTPSEGIAKRNENRVLINLHGGVLLLRACK